MTWNTVIMGLHRYGISVRATGCFSGGKPEYRIAYKGRNQEASAYYTDDPSDALATGQMMFRESAISTDVNADISTE